MKGSDLKNKGGAGLADNRSALLWFKVMLSVMVLLVAGGVLFLMFYQPPADSAAAPLSFEQKMAQVQSGTALAQAKAPLVIPHWLVALVFGFAFVQMLALVAASHRAKTSQLTERDVRQIEFLVETPMFLGLLGSLVGICMMQFISGSLAAPIAYLTSITGIVFYIFGRFTILESLPAVSERS